MVNLFPQNTYNQYKIRKVSETVNGNVYAITIPREIAKRFLNIKFKISISGNNILLTSGLDLALLKKEVDKYDIMNL